MHRHRAVCAACSLQLNHRQKQKPPRVILCLLLFFFPSCVAAHTQHLSAAGRNGCDSCQSKCSSPFVQVVLQLGTRMSPKPKAPGKQLGEGRQAVNDLSLGMGITQVVTGRG